MSLKNFRSYQLSITFYQHCARCQLPGHLKDQLLRAASSVSLNLAEGSGRRTQKDKIKFYNIAFSSLRECQAVIDLHANLPSELAGLADTLGAMLYKLCHQ